MSDGTSIVDQIEVAETQLPTGVSADQVTFEQVQGLPADLVGPIRWDHPCAAHMQVIDAKQGIVVPSDGRKRKKVCIVGYAENSRHLAWWNDPDCEIWGVNQLYRFIPRADRWFQIHTDWHDSKKWAAGTDLRQWLTDSPIPTYMTAVDSTIPNSVAYPIDWVKQQLGLQVFLGGQVVADHDYFTSTIAFMLALAIAEGFEEIGIYGIDLIIGREYFFEKACAEFYLGIAHARGIAVHKPENSALLWQSHRYGYDKEPDYGFYGLEKLKVRSQQLQKQVSTKRDEVMQAQGRIEEAELVLKQLGEPSRSEYEKHIADLRTNLDGLLNSLFLHDGAMQEINRMYAILEIRSRGGQVE